MFVAKKFSHNEGLAVKFQRFIISGNIKAVKAISARGGGGGGGGGSQNLCWGNACIQSIL